MIQPNTPPKTEASAAIAANRSDFAGFAKHMGTMITSAGTGKTELSKKAVAAKTHCAWREWDAACNLLLRRENI